MEIIEIHFDTINSTNTYAKTHGSSFATGKITCIIAEEQTAGKGQFQRKWASPRGVNLYATFYFHLPKQTKKITELAILLAISIKKVLEKNELHPTMKWPNDVLINGKKIAGVLCETEVHASYIEIILGFGLNVNMEGSDLALIDQPATSLKNETGRLWDKKILLKQIQAQFLIDLDLFKKSNNLNFGFIL
jgi:BirA family biotin operon repressor/biotin-[acetyl-CoA-carboxylase] ligase